MSDACPRGVLARTLARPPCTISTQRLSPRASCRQTARNEVVGSPRDDRAPATGLSPAIVHEPRTCRPRATQCTTGPLNAWVETCRTMSHRAHDPSAHRDRSSCPQKPQHVYGAVGRRSYALGDELLRIDLFKGISGFRSRPRSHPMGPSCRGSRESRWVHARRARCTCAARRRWTRVRARGRPGSDSRAGTPW
jgi:hypothetical protein